jgi:processive 1,2-diacylglycerol beta-glucosyltransferase
MSKKKVLFISAPIGSGHTKVAQAVGKALCTQNDDVEIKIANLFDFFNSTLGNLMLKLYLKVLDTFPQLYAKAYSWGNNSRLALVGRGLISRYLAKRMYSFISNYNPTAIVCTHATPAGLSAYLIRKGQLQIPVFAVVTDFVVHRLWVYQEITHYFVAHEDMKNYLNVFGVKPVKIQISGIPVDENFTLWTDREKTLKKLNLYGNIKTILVMGGGAGVLPMKEIVKLCDN